VLVVDDNASIRRVLGDMCRASGCHVSAASTAEEALGWMAGEGFDLVLSDIRMPGLGGFDLLDAVTRQQPCPSVVLITGAPSPEEAAIGRRRGAFDYLSKPFTSAEVRTLLDRLRSDREARRSEGIAP
jgi:DNA-binding NtrC family response regulator